MDLAKRRRLRRVRELREAERQACETIESLETWTEHDQRRSYRGRPDLQLIMGDAEATEQPEPRLRVV